MAVTLTINGVDYEYPETGDVDWGPDATDWAQAVTTGMLQKAGGLFTLLAETDFGGSFGLKSLYYKSRSSNVSSTGTLRLALSDSIGFRNNANNADLLLTVSGSNTLLFNGLPIGNVASVTDTNSIDLTITGTTLSADLKLSAAAAGAGNQLVNLDIQSDGLRARIANSDIVAAAAGTYQPVGNYITALTGDVTATGPGSSAATIANSAVTLAKMANLAANSIIGNNTGSSATPIALTGAQTTALLSNFVGDSGSGGTKGLVPAPATGDAAANKFLKADGTWAATPAGPTTATPTVAGIVTSFAPTVASSVTTVTSNNYTILTTDGFSTVLVSTGSSTRTITLPASSSNVGRTVFIQKTDTGTGSVTITRAGSDTIQGFTTLTLTNQYDCATLVGVGSNLWLIQNYTPNSMIQMSGGNGYGSTATKVRRFTTTTVNIGAAMTLATDATNGTVVTIVEPGLYAMIYQDTRTGSTSWMGITINAAVLTTNVQSQPSANILSLSTNVRAGEPGLCSLTTKLAAGDVIRCMTDGGMDETDPTAVRFRIVQVQRY